jgi:hypothetical protein
MFSPFVADRGRSSCLGGASEAGPNERAACA